MKQKCRKFRKTNSIKLFLQIKRRCGIISYWDGTQPNNKHKPKRKCYIFHGCFKLFYTIKLINEKTQEDNNKS